MSTKGLNTFSLFTASFICSRCCHCNEKIKLDGDAVKRSRTYSCKPCNNARKAVLAAYKEKGQMALWSKMSKADQRKEILANKGKAVGRGRKFPVQITEQARPPPTS